MTVVVTIWPKKSGKIDHLNGVSARRRIESITHAMIAPSNTEVHGRSSSVGGGSQRAVVPAMERSLDTTTQVRDTRPGRPQTSNMSVVRAG